jgi:Protein of unknown function (DUF4239)
VIVHVLIVWGVIASAIALAVLVHGTKTADDDSPDYRVVLGFVGSAYGLLTGLLVVFAVGHYNDTRHRAEDEAASLVSLYDTVAVYPREVVVPYRHDLICYMRSIIADEWPSMERGNSTETSRTLAFGDRIRAATRELPSASAPESSAYGRAATQVTDADQARQELLFFTQPEIPTALWVLVYVGAFLIVFLIAAHYIVNPRVRIAALGSLALLLTVVVAVLAVLDRPFGVGVRVEPTEMRQAITLVSVGANPAIVQPCPARPQG